MDIVFERRGKGPPLVLIPGPGRRAAWRPVSDLLAADHEILVLGDSPDGLSPGADPGSLAVQLELALAGLGMDCPHIAGDSLGGLLALEAAERAIVASATALSPTGFAPRPGLRHADAVLRAVRFGASLPGAVLEHLFAAPLQRSLRLRAGYGGPLLPSAEELVADDESARPAVRPRQDRFTGVLADVPVALAWSGHDHRSPPPEALRARDLLPHVRHMWLPGRHGPLPCGDPEAVAGIIRHTVRAAERHRIAVGS